jgi:kinesin family member 2/24
VSSILEEEEAVIAAHRQQIEDNMGIVQQEMKLLQEVELPGGSVDVYVASLEKCVGRLWRGVDAARLLAKKQDCIVQLRRRLAEFSQRLREEENLSRSLKKS